MNALNGALRDYARLSEAATLQSPGHTPEAWDDVAARIEAGVNAADLEGDERTFALARAKDARANAQWLRPRARQQSRRT